MKKRIADFEPEPTQRELDKTENSFLKKSTRIWRTATDYFTVTPYREPSFSLPAQLEIALSTLWKEFVETVTLLGYTRAVIEIERSRPLTPLKFAKKKKPKEEPGEPEKPKDLPERPRPLFFTSETIAQAAQSVILEKYNEKARGIVQKTIVEEGGSIADGMKALKEEFPMWSKKDLERAARTISNFSFNQGRMHAFLEGGIPAVEVTAILDSRICPICRGLDGIILPVPPRGRYVPPFHYQCRCTLLPVIEDDPDISKMLETDEDVEKAADENVSGMTLKIRRKEIEIKKWPGVAEGFGFFIPMKEIPNVPVPTAVKIGLKESKTMIEAIETALSKLFEEQ